MSKENEYVILFKALADETRLKIVKMLAKEPMCPCHLLEAFHISQPTLSYHIKILCEAGLVEGERKGAVMECRVNPNKIKLLKTLFEAIEQASETNMDNEGI